MVAFAGTAEPLTRQGFRQVVDSLGIGISELLALLAVESRSCGFLPDRRPVILFERHIFHRLTNGRFSGAHPDISHPQPGGYAFGAQEYPRLAKAVRLDRAAALKSASWGAGQVMGFNHQAVGWPDVESLVADMMASEDLQLQAVAGFIRSSGLVEPMMAHDWARVARIYNGKDYAKNKYDVRLAAEHNRYATAKALPDLDVRRAQLYFNYLGVPLTVDGLYGRLSRSAVLDFKAQMGLGGGERIDKALLDALQARVAAR